MQYKMIDLFAGIGGIRIAFQQVSPFIQCVMSSEINKFAVQTYESNFSGGKMAGDITTLDMDDVPDHNILTAGFPCQPFSQAGKGLGFDDTRGTLFFDIIRIIKAKQPAMILLENVARLMTHDKGNTMRVIKQELLDAGYNNLHITKLKAKDFGLPQIRERTYIVGFLDDKIKFKFPEPPRTKTQVRDVLSVKVDDKYTISDKRWEGMKTAKKRNRANGKGFGYSKVTPDSPYTNTILRQYYKDGKSILIDQGDKNPRRLTPREAARLQGFSDLFHIPVSDAQAYRQFGNSVAIPVVKAIATNMINAHAHERITILPL